ncbi:MAG: hypothetical protein E4G97_00070 [Deltaproteobacteria bacterium]|nr:MAG: hypothetical protein E4G97_00070 [Deltaproteobacteria bacterium]
MTGRKAFTPIIAPLSNASPEREGIKKKMNRREKKNRAIPGLRFGYEIFMLSSGEINNIAILCNNYAIRMPLF